MSTSDGQPHELADCLCLNHRWVHECQVPTAAALLGTMTPEQCEATMAVLGALAERAPLRGSVAGGLLEALYQDLLFRWHGYAPEKLRGDERGDVTARVRAQRGPVSLSEAVGQ